MNSPRPCGACLPLNMCGERMWESSREKHSSGILAWMEGVGSRGPWVWWLDRDTVRRLGSGRQTVALPGSEGLLRSYGGWPGAWLFCSQQNKGQRHPPCFGFILCKPTMLRGRKDVMWVRCFWVLLFLLFAGVVGRAGGMCRLGIHSLCAHPMCQAPCGTRTKPSKGSGISWGSAGPT